MAVTYTKTEWTDRVVQRPRTYTHVENSDESVTHTPAPGLVLFEGTPRNALNMNHIEQGIADCADAINALEAAATTEKVYAVTIPATGWNGSAAPYTRTVTVSGMKAADTPFVDLALTGTYATDQAMCDDWSQVYRITTANNSITVYANDIPSAAIKVKVRCLRHG